MKEYFSHDYNARHDKKIAALVSKYKGAGYGIFWTTCEMMHDEGGEIELDDITYSCLAKDINENENLLKKVIEDCIEKFKLFVLVDGKLSSNRVKKNLNKRLSISEIRSKSGKAGANAKQMKANAKQNQANKRKGKEIKEKEIIEINKEVFKKDMSKFPLADNFNGLPEKKVEASIGIIKATQDVIASKEQINTFWDVFKIQRLTGENFYENDEKIYEHFINWVKDKKISSKGMSEYEKKLVSDRDKAKKFNYE